MLVYQRVLTVSSHDLWGSAVLGAIAKYHM